MSNSPSIDEIRISNGLFLEASAGTGKTYTVAALVTRELAMNDDLRIGDILISTFTRNAAAELRDRVRRRIIEMADIVAVGQAVPGDVLSSFLCQHNTDKRQQIVANLRRAAVEFDTATIGTIHSVCSRILVLAGLPSGSGDESSTTKELIQQKVNDYVASLIVAEAELKKSGATDLPPRWNPENLGKLVEQKLSATDAALWVDNEHSSVHHLNKLAVDVEEMVRSIQLATKNNPTFDDLLRRAVEVMTNSQYAVAVSSIRQKYRMAFVDEAQDTDPLQWIVFREIIQKISQDSFLVVVGDPKQSIYRFRGADVNAYLEQRDPNNLISLNTNYRSDEYLVDALNELMDGKSFGDKIDYVKVNSAPKNQKTRLANFKPVEIVSLGDRPTLSVLHSATALRVAQLLKNAEINNEKVSLSDVCVLVRSNDTGKAIEHALRQMKIPAVSGGTASVLASEAARALTLLLLALERPSDIGRVRSAVASMFFGRSLLDPAIISTGAKGNDQLSNAGIEAEHDFIRVLHRVLNKDGIAAMETQILGHSACLAAILGSERAERRLTDLRHLIELVHRGTEGQGINASTALQVLADLSTLDATAELVSRRIESDEDAVKILTIHAAKGLEFPIVVVADMWNDPSAADSASSSADEKIARRPPMFLSPVPDADGKRHRCIDVAWVFDKVPTPSVRVLAEAEVLDEMKRQFYVAVTRAKHHLSLLLPPESDKCIAYQCINGEKLADNANIPVVPIPPRLLPKISDRKRPKKIQPFDASTEQTYRRTSFSGITDIAAGRESQSLHLAPGSGLDERPEIVGRAASAPIHVDTGTDMPLARVPKGTYIGTVIHSIFENFESSDESLHDEMSRLVDRFASGPSLIGYREELIKGLVLAAQTPLGPLMGNTSLASISSQDRLAELSFEMGLAHLSRDVRVRNIGEVLLSLLSTDDPLYPYARQLSGEQFDIPLAGLLNGSIDAVLRVPQPDGSSRLFITDYKSNRLDTEDDERLIDAYHPSRLVDAMTHHHYPLQAILYGVAIHRFLRWKSPTLSSDDVIGGVAYFFLRGMVNDPHFIDQHGCPYGVFQWTAPKGLWGQLSDMLGGTSHA